MSKQMETKQGSGFEARAQTTRKTAIRMAMHNEFDRGDRRGSHAKVGGFAPAAGSYAFNDMVLIRKKRKRRKRIVRILICVLVALLLIIGGVAGYAAWYMHSLTNNISLNAEDQQQLNEVLLPVEDNKVQPYYVLLVGSDNWESYGERSDALVLLRVDQANHKITMVSVPRDTPYMLNGQKVKINQAYAEEGAIGAVEAVEQLTGVQIAYYAQIEFAGLAEFVDSVGGIDVNVPYTIDYQVYTHDQDVVHVEAGLQHLDGEHCVALARMRTAYGDDQDAKRQSNVRAMTESLMKTVLKASPTAIPGLVQDLSKCFSTSMAMDDIISLATDFSAAGETTIYTCTGPYKGDIDEETGLWLCYEDPQGWANLMSVVNKGEDPASATTTINGK